MPYERIFIAPLSPVIGAEVSGVDLSKPLGNQTFEEIHDALVELGVYSSRERTQITHLNKYGNHALIKL